MKTLPEETNSRLEDAECISDLEDNIMESTQAEEQIEKNFKKWR